MTKTVESIKNEVRNAIATSDLITYKNKLYVIVGIDSNDVISLLHDSSEDGKTTITVEEFLADCESSVSKKITTFQNYGGTSRLHHPYGTLRLLYKLYRKEEELNRASDGYTYDVKRVTVEAVAVKAGASVVILTRSSEESTVEVFAFVVATSWKQSKNPSYYTLEGLDDRIAVATQRYLGDSVVIKSLVVKTMMSGDFVITDETVDALLKSVL